MTDLDGCLLDYRTYEFKPARSALARLERHAVQLILCTSRTRSEVRYLYRQLAAPPIAIIEDGGGILVPRRALRCRIPGARRASGGRLLGLAPPYGVVRRVFAGIRRATGGSVLGFGDMDPIGISELTGLDLRAAGRAARREFDEPFVYLSRSRELRRRVRALAARCDLVVTRGGRFDHLHGKTDKGVAVRRVRELVEASAGPLRMVALGDSPMDLAFLSAAEVPIIVPGPDGRPNRLLRRRLPAARTAPAPGPAGWAAAIHCALDDAGLDGN